MQQELHHMELYGESCYKLWDLIIFFEKKKVFRQEVLSAQFRINVQTSIFFLGILFIIKTMNMENQCGFKTSLYNQSRTTFFFFLFAPPPTQRWSRWGPRDRVQIEERQGRDEVRCQVRSVQQVSHYKGVGLEGQQFHVESHQQGMSYSSRT